MRILKVEPGQVPYEKDIPNTLESIQAEVGGGLFQPLYVGEGIVLCCNEEGNSMAWNPTADWVTISSAALFSLWGTVSPVILFP